VILLAGSLRMSELVRVQQGIPGGSASCRFANWFVFSQPIGFVIFFICALAETNRGAIRPARRRRRSWCGLPHEYSSMKFAMFFMAE